MGFPGISSKPNNHFEIVGIKKSVQVVVKDQDSPVGEDFYRTVVMLFIKETKDVDIYAND